MSDGIPLIRNIEGKAAFYFAQHPIDQQTGFDRVGQGTRTSIVYTDVLLKVEPIAGTSLAIAR